MEGRQPGDYYHDGFYLRLALGMSYGWLAGTGPLGSASLSGNGPAFAIAAGGTPARGLVLALSLMIGSVNGVLAGAPPASTGSVTSVEPVLGALVDWYPRPEHGWHVGGSLGLGGVGVTDASGSNSNGYSLGVAALGGHDWWIAPQWSLGVLAFLAVSTPASTRYGNGDATGYRFTPVTLGLEVSLLLH